MGIRYEENAVSRRPRPRGAQASQAERCRKKEATAEKFDQMIMIIINEVKPGDATPKKGRALPARQAKSGKTGSRASGRTGQPIDQMLEMGGENVCLE